VVGISHGIAWDDHGGRRITGNDHPACGNKTFCGGYIPKHSEVYCYDGFIPDRYEYHGQFLLIEKASRKDE